MNYYLSYATKTFLQNKSILVLCFCFTILGQVNAEQAFIPITEEWQKNKDLTLLKEKLKFGSPEEKEEVLNLFVNDYPVELVPDVIEATLDDAESPKHGDTGWARIHHQAATALSQFAQTMDGLSPKERGYKNFTFFEDGGVGTAPRRIEVHDNWIQWWNTNKSAVKVIRQ